MSQLITDLSIIKENAEKNSTENDRFRTFLKQQDGEMIDRLVHENNRDISLKIDCTQCGNCCKSLMINVTAEESIAVAGHLAMQMDHFKEKYLEESEQGHLLMNEIPCAFLTGTKCSIYQNRFSECREFPHLHKPNFNQRLFGTLMYYAMCPIIYNVVERLKIQLNFR